MIQFLEGPIPPRFNKGGGGFQLCTFIWKMKSLKNVSGNILCFFCSLSYGDKVIIKVVSNIIGIGYGITIIKGEYSWYNECYSF